MNVKQLQAWLAKLPQDKKVKVQNRDVQELWDIQDVHFITEENCVIIFPVGSDS